MPKFPNRLCALLILAVCCFGNLQAATTYLLIQGPFGTAGAMETHKWKILYNEGTLNTGLDVMMAVFGIPSQTGTIATDFDDPLFPSDYYTSTNGANGAAYIDFNNAPGTGIVGTSLFLESLTIHGTTVKMGSDYDPGWNAFAAGGSNGLTGIDAEDYDSLVWTIGSSGLNSRPILDGTFNAWTFGAYDTPITNSDDNISTSLMYDPLVANFNDAIVIDLTAVPEPGRALLVVLGGIMLVFRRRRIHA